MKAVSCLLIAALALPTLATARDMSPEDVRKLPATAPTLTEAYGADPHEIGELRVPKGKGPFPVAIVIHGGCWTKGFETIRGTAPIASALAAKGIATWNVEYRQIGDPGGGWPGTFIDWANGADHLRTLAKRYPLDLKRVIVVGHSAGALAALWVAARPRLDPAITVRGSDPLRVRAAVAIDGPGDLAPFVGKDKAVCGAPVISQLLGGTPDAVPDRYRDGSPFRALPLGLPQTLVASAVLDPSEAETYRAAAAAKGDAVTVVTTPNSDHFNIIAPGEPQWAAVEAAILKAIPPE
ncbi:alpha/beta hydrolase family protein [Sphingomonas sp. MMS24-J45]|uniref:alpha/beta hydrolase family protein n=1 Tax=Sphingomonas sp. MMS24-J45 TaxID=3238806 RepID=UPI00384F2DA1